MSTNVSIPPSNLEAERGVLAGVLRDPDVMPDVFAVVRPEAMHFDAHQKIFTALVSIAARGEPIDLVMLHAELKSRKQLDDIGGVGYLTEIWEAVPTGANATYHAKLVRDAHLLRSLAHTLNESLRDVYSPTAPADELLATAERRIHALSLDATGGGKEPQLLSQAVRRTLNVIDERIRNGDALAGLSTGYPDLDRITGGLAPGELIVVGARPSLGKTAISLNITRNVAMAGIPALFFSLEMPEQSITERLLSMETGVPMSRMSRPRELRPEDINALAQAETEVFSALPLHIEDTPNQTAARIATVARRSSRRHGIRLVVVDYLQLIHPDNPRENRTQQVGAMTLAMKNLARSLNVPLILLAQLNRELEHTNRKPKLSDLRESGDIEAHADRVLMLHRESNLNENDPVWPIDVIVSKNRNGPIGEIRLSYRRPVLRFENAAIGA